MMGIKRIRISGFRGILAPLELDFGEECQSVILYGANGTGKSSITDAWEWLTTGKIQHLAREGAEEGAYPHMAAKPGETYVEVEFSDPQIGTVRLMYDHSRITKPKATQNLSRLRQLIAHPCHIRYGDLTRFVLLRKADRYDALANLMGFVPQMEYQKALRRVQANLDREVTNLNQLVQEAENRFKTHFSQSQVNISKALEQMVNLCLSYKINVTPDIEEIKVASQQLQKLVIQDPMAKKLADYRSLEAAIQACTVSQNVINQLTALREAIGRLKAEQHKSLAEQLLVPLFQAADELLSSFDTSGKCPLCGQSFDGDLREHVRNELAKMQHLRELLNHLNQSRGDLSNTLAAQKSLSQSFDVTLDEAQPDVEKQLLQNFRTAINDLDSCIDRIRHLLMFESTALDDKLLSDFCYEENTLPILFNSFIKTKEILLTETRDKKTALEKDPSRIKLVADEQFINKGVELVQEVKEKSEKLKHASKILAEYMDLVDDYVRACISDVQARFEEISDKVKLFFELLEKHTEGLGAPKLKLLPDQDRSVVLEVGFHGSVVDPAYKFLSESQLSSFGLAVFLASATHFNRDCRFLILDDIVNSLDAYKRPILIDLIKNHLQDRQILLLTHDRFWRDLLHRSLPTWNKINFIAYNFGIGPTMKSGLHALERVDEALARDEPEEAGRTLAQYMEDMLQEISERFECEVKFNRRNEYTLDTLLDRLRIRTENKLKANHPLVKALVDLIMSNGYRNWVTHCKNPESPIHKLEINEVLQKWRLIESMVVCPESGCFEVLRWDGKNAFSCQCGKTRLTKED